MKHLIIFWICAIAIMIPLFAWKDRVIQRSAEAYADCVWETYGMSPSNFYQENGEYPECIK